MAGRRPPDRRRLPGRSSPDGASGAGRSPRRALSSGSVDRGARGPICPGRRDRAPGLCLDGLRGVRAGGVRRREGRAREGRAGAPSGRAGDRLRDSARRQRKAPFRRTGRRGGGPRGRFGGAGGKRRGGRGGGRIPNGSGEPRRKRQGGPRRGRGRRRKATLRITGDRGAAFSVVCSVGEAERTVEGQALERYTLEPRGKDVRCEVRTEGGGVLRIVFTDGACAPSTGPAAQRAPRGSSTRTAGFLLRPPPSPSSRARRGPADLPRVNYPG